jgi:hypothetical protein
LIRTSENLSEKILFNISCWLRSGQVNNAGVMACPLQYTVDGFEYQFGVS